MPPKKKSVCKKHGKTGACKNHGTTNNNKNQGGPPKYQKPPCFNFQQYGDCRFGGSCIYFHDKRFARPSQVVNGPGSGQYGTPELPRIVCAQFRQTGNCWYGHTCQSAHELDSSSPEHREYVSVNSSESRPQRQILGPRSSATPSGPVHEQLPDQMERFLKTTLATFDTGTPEAVQQVIGDIATDSGLRRLGQLTGADFALQEEPGSLKLSFKRHCIPFLKVMAHREMSASLVLEAEVGIVFRFLFGPQGHRAVNLFKRVSQTLATITRQENRIYIEEVLLAAGGAIFTMLNLNDSVKVRSEFQHIVTTFDNILAEGSSDGTNNYTFRLAEETLSRVKVNLRMTEALPKPIGSQPRSAPRPTYQSHSIDLPGELSHEGPRHDNDHADISKIRVLPTNDEIRSHRNEYIPQRGLEYPHHLQGIARVIDFQFRLLREDTSGQIRLAIRNIISNWAEMVKVVDERGKKTQAGDPGARTVIHRNVTCDSTDCTQKDGLVLNIKFDQPSKVVMLNHGERKEWWGNAKCMEVGTLLCLLDIYGRSTFLIVSERIVSLADTLMASNSYAPGQRGGEQTEQEIPIGQDLASDPYRAMVTLKLACKLSVPDIQNLFKPAKVDQVLVEFPGLLLTSFEPILKCLQLVSKTGNVPFTRWLAPSPGLRYPSQRNSEYVDVPPPLYMTEPGASLDLGAITGGRPLSYSTSAGFHVEDLQQATTLDPGQCNALVASLSRELALIQGPPGTGKSYLGLQLVKVLLANTKTTKIGPIVCVCYTNHALDQFLEHLLEGGIKRIIRIGTRSQSEAVMPYTLNNVSRRADRTRPEMNRMNKSRGKLEQHRYSINSACEQLLFHYDSNSLRSFLETAHPGAFAELFANADASGYHSVRKGGAHQVLMDWTQDRGLFYHRKALRASDRPVEELVGSSVYLMWQKEKLRLLEHWYGGMREVASCKLIQGTDDHELERGNLAKQRQEQDRRCLQGCQVIGVTTTGFAMNINLIRSINAKVIICEEAGEVLEAHILSTLLPTTQHAVLIGDHQQLRPQIMNYDFSVENPRGGGLYRLDTSLFEQIAEERFGGKRFPVVRLDTQRRMHSSIANLVRNTLYPYLVDHPSTVDHPTVVGMSRRLFWMDHRRAESGADKQDPTQMSHANEFEADMIAQLVRYLSRQGVYKNGEIAVLSPYLRQIFILRRKLSMMFDVIVGDSDQAGLDVMNEAAGIGDLEVTPTVKTGALLNEVRVATVDNFQGEEAKVIIISMVRSNRDRKCGFLRTPNRINVLLSRARDGMYIFGNTETFADVPMWSKVIRMLGNDGSIGGELEIRCPRHPGPGARISEPRDFAKFAPEGGCIRPCNIPNDCGHPCSKSCHSELLHQSIVCLEYCERGYKFCNHPCPNVCWFPCGECQVPVNVVPLPCGHPSPPLLCYQLQSLGDIRCHTIVDQVCPQGHRRRRECWEDPANFKCNKICGGILTCGHKCGAMCKECHKPSVGNEISPISHRRCEVPCGKALSNCLHQCIAYCHGSEPCPPCSKPCGKRCVHSRCPKKCSDPCPPCAEVCSWTCTHSSDSCQKPCAIPCGVTPCPKRCPKLLSCGHQCPSMCRDECPSQAFCQICGTEQVKGHEVDLVSHRFYYEIDLDVDPIIVPTCGHFYTFRTFDSRMNIDTSGLGDLGRSLNKMSLSTVAPPQTRCLDCPGSLETIHRYNRIVKPALLDDSARRFCVDVQARYASMLDQTSRAIETLQSTNQEFVSAQLRNDTMKKSAGGKVPPLVKLRIKGANDISLTLKRFVLSITAEEGPYLRLHEVAIAAQKGKNIEPTLLHDYSPIQCSFRLKSQCLLLDLTWAVLWDTHLIAADSFMAGLPALTLRNQILKDLESTHSASSMVVKDCMSANLGRFELQARIRGAQFVALYRLEHNKVKDSLKKNQRQLPSSFNDVSRQAELNSLDRCDELDRILSGSARLMKDEIQRARGLLHGGLTLDTAATVQLRKSLYESLSAELSPTGRWFTCPSGHPFTVADSRQSVGIVRCPECGSGTGRAWD